MILNGKSVPRYYRIIPGLFLAYADFIDVYMFCFRVLFQSIDAEFSSDAALLVATEGRAFVQQMPFVDPYRACPQQSRDVHCFLRILRPYPATQAVDRIVRHSHRIIDRFVMNDGEDGTEDLLLCDR